MYFADHSGVIEKFCKVGAGGRGVEKAQTQAYIEGDVGGEERTAGQKISECGLVYYANAQL